MKEAKSLGEAQQRFRNDFRLKIKAQITLQVICSLFAIVLVISAIALYGLKLYQVKGDGMYTELRGGDTILGNRLAYKMNTPKRGDVVVTKDGDIYRIIGLPRETVEFNGGFVYVNSVILNEESYLGNDKFTKSTIYNSNSYVVPEDNYLVLSDNRNCRKNVEQGKLFIPRTSIESKIIWKF